MEDGDPEALLRRQIKRRGRVVAVGITIVACVAMYPCCSVVYGFGSEAARQREIDAQYEHEATPEQRAAVETALARAEATLPAHQAEFTAATRAIASLVPRPDLGPCPIHIPLRTASSAERGGSVDLNYDPFEVYGFGGEPSFPWALSSETSAPRVTLARDRIEELRSAIGSRGLLETIAGTVTAAEELNDAFWTWDVVVVPGEWHMPYADATGSTFDGGYVNGIAYVHDYASGSVICAGEFEATTTSQVVDYQAQILNEGSTLTRMLQNEMNAEIERAISRSVVYRAGPPLDVGPSE